MQNVPLIKLKDIIKTYISLLVEMSFNRKMKDQSETTIPSLATQLMLALQKILSSNVLWPQRSHFASNTAEHKKMCLKLISPA